MKLLRKPLEYIQNHTPENDRNIEFFYNSLKMDYVWPEEFQDYGEASVAIEKAFTDYNEKRPHFSIDYLSPKRVKEEVPESPIIQGRLYQETRGQTK